MRPGAVVSLRVESVTLLLWLWQAGGDCARIAEARSLRHPDHGKPRAAALHHGDAAHH